MEEGEVTRLVNSSLNKTVSVFEITDNSLDFNDKTRKQRRTNINWPIICMYIIANVLYILSLYKCNDPSEAVCWKEIFPIITRLLLMVCLSSLIFSTIYLLPFFYKFDYKYIAINLLNQYVLYNLDDGQTLQSHGDYNRILFALMTVLFIILGLYYIAFCRLFNKLHKLFKLILVAGLIVYCYRFYTKTLVHSCDNWYLGLKDSIMDNGVGCKISKPNICWLEISNRVFDLSNWFKLECKGSYKYNTDEELFYKDKEIIAFPDTKEFNFYQRSYKNVQKTVFDYLKEIEPSQIIDEEVVLDRRDKNNPKFIINLKRNETVANAAKEVKEKQKHSGADIPLTENFLFIFFDTISRTQFRRKLPKVYSWIERYYNNKTSPVESFQFFKYQGSQPNTQLTLSPILTGQHPTLKESTSYMIHKYFKDFGFVTAQTMNICNSVNLNYEPDDDKSFLWTNFDHELFTPFCDINYWYPGKEYGLFYGPYSSFRRCLYGKDTFEYMLDYASQFWKAYPEERKYIEMYFMDGHEITNEVITYLDSHVYDWLVEHEETFFKTKTTLVFITDHGLHMNGFSEALNLEDIIKELVLPNLMVVAPREIADSGLGEQLKKNENVMIGAYDIHSFLQEISGARQFSRYGTSLMREIGNRQCTHLHVMEKMCRCKDN
jgi:hypothetical protein